MMKKKEHEKSSGKWKLAFFGTLLLAGFLIVFGYLTETYGEVTGWKFYALMAGSVLSVVVILVGIHKATKK